MLGKFVGFAVVLGETARLRAVSLFDLLASSAAVDFTKAGERVAISMHRKDHYMYGKVIRYMDEGTLQKARKGEDGEVEITVQTLEEGEERVAVSYFVFSVKSFRGLYFNYGGAYPFAGVRQWIEQSVRTVISLDRKTLPPTGKLKKGAVDPFACRCDLLIREESLPEILREWQKISGFQVTCATLHPSVKDYGPMSRLLHREAHIFYLDSQYMDGAGPMRAAIQLIVDSIPWAKRRFGALAKTKLLGKNEHGSDVTIDLDKVADAFDVMDVGEAITDLELKRKRHYDTVVGKRMADIIGEHDHYFGVFST